MLDERPREQCGGPFPKPREPPAQAGVPRACRRLPDDPLRTGGAIRPETGRPGDDLVPVIGKMSFLNEEQKLDIFHNNCKLVAPAFSKLG